MIKKKNCPDAVWPCLPWHLYRRCTILVLGRACVDAMGSKTRDSSSENLKFNKHSISILIHHIFFEIHSISILIHHIFFEMSFFSIRNLYIGLKTILLHGLKPWEE